MPYIHIWISSSTERSFPYSEEHSSSFLGSMLCNTDKKSTQDSGPQQEHLLMLLHSVKGQSQKPNSQKQSSHPLKSTLLSPRSANSSAEPLSKDLVPRLNNWAQLFAFYSALISLQLSNCIFICFKLISMTLILLQAHEDDCVSLDSMPKLKINRMTHTHTN